MFVGLFLVMMGYLCYFNVVKSRDMIRNSHNARLDSLAERVVRGKILDKNGKVLAQTTTSEDEQVEKLRSVYEGCGYPCVFTSALEERNIEKIKELLKGKTTVIAGPSGVGKSSLINILNPDAKMETGDISSKIERGKHTTRHSELFTIAQDSYIMDTPGFSSLYVNDFEKEELKYYFPEFDPYEGTCRFLGCDHVHEPDCAVKAAVEAGEIHEIRYKDYLEMYEELKSKRRY